MSSSWRNWWTGLTWRNGKTKNQAGKARRWADRPRALLKVEHLEMRQMPSLSPPFAWTALGPAAIQTTDPGNPTWSGRITGIAVDNLTGAEYVTAAGGGVWKSLNERNNVDAPDRPNPG
jgi:hypothetical protein